MGSSPIEGIQFMVKYHDKVKIFWFKSYFFNSFWIQKILNRFMINGKKATIEKEFFLCFKELKKISNTPLFLIFGVLQKSLPLVGLKKVKGKGRISKRKGRRKIRVPFPATRVRRQKIGLK